MRLRPTGDTTELSVGPTPGPTDHGMRRFPDRRFERTGPVNGTPPGYFERTRNNGTETSTNHAATAATAATTTARNGSRS